MTMKQIAKLIIALKKCGLTYEQICFVIYFIGTY